MTDELREALDNLTTLPDHPDGEDFLAFALIQAAARAHLGCSTITDEQVDAAYDVLWQHLSKLGESERWMRSWIGAALEAAARVGTEKP